MGEYLADKIKTHFTKEDIKKAVHRQDNVRRFLEYQYLIEKNNGAVFSYKVKPIKKKGIPVLYLAGGMVPSLPQHQQAWRITKENWQDYVIKKTGGDIRRDTTTLNVIGGVTYGNAVFENPMENGPCTRRLFTPIDYIRILISHGSLNFVQAGHNKEGNPGFAQLAEIVAQYAKGGLNIILNEKGEMNKDSPGLYDKDAALYDKFVYQPECLITSLDEAVEMINTDDGKLLNKLIRDSNKQREDYLKSIKEEKYAKVFIAGSEKNDWAREAEKHCKGSAIRYMMANDLINPEEDPIGYLKQMDNCDLALIYHSSAINNSNNRLLPLAISAYAVMTKKPVVYISEPLQNMEAILETNPEFADRTVRISRPRENFLESQERKNMKAAYDTMRYMSEFIPDAPFHYAYQAIEFGRGMQDLKMLADIAGFGKTLGQRMKIGITQLVNNFIRSYISIK